MLNIIENEQLKNHTTFRIGGPAKYFVVVKNSEEIEEAINWAKANKQKWTVIGGGSNLLISDNGYDGLVIKFFGASIEISESLTQAQEGEEIEIKISAGAPLALALNKTLQFNLSGLQWSIGIPGTIGGAVCGNAGAYGHDISESVQEVEVLRGDQIMILPKGECDFGYRCSAFKRDGNSDIILSVKLKLLKVSEEAKIAIQEKNKDIITQRSQKFNGASAGSFFQNVFLTPQEVEKVKLKHQNLPEEFVGWQKIPAAWLIDQCELKGKTIGGAKVSEVHAGTIINTGDATAEDVIMLASIIKQKVRSRFGLQLHEEVKYLGFDN